LGEKEKQGKEGQKETRLLKSFQGLSDQSLQHAEALHLEILQAKNSIWSRCSERGSAEMTNTTSPGPDQPKSKQI
jgi:hypothetical protein